jgi:hypothetical protein
MNDKQTTYQFLLDFCKEKNVKFKEFRRDWEVGKCSWTIVLFK